MSVLMQASKQWATRPDDQRFLSLIEMESHFQRQRRNSRGAVYANRAIEARPLDDFDQLAIQGPQGAIAAPTNWAFGQLCARAAAPAGYLRTLPAPMAADCLNYGMRTRDVEELGILIRRDEESGALTLDAATGPNYGRVWNDQIISALVRRFGDGVTGDFKVPGEFGQDVEITKGNTTLYASDRDFFVFLADEKNRVTIPNRRNGQSGSLARGFFVWNSEVGAQTLGVATFLFDYACSNRIVWGAEGFKEIKLRHTAGVPYRYMEEVAPMLEAYSQSACAQTERVLVEAQNTRLGDKDKVREFLAKRFTKSQAGSIMAAHESDEGRPIETAWDAVTGITAYARGVQHQDARVALEREAGKILTMVE